MNTIIVHARETENNRHGVVTSGEVLWVDFALGPGVMMTVFLSPAEALRLADELRALAPVVQNVIEAMRGAAHPKTGGV
jgi:hypothetical protein